MKEKLQKALFGNIGGKIKSVAFWFAIVWAILCELAGIIVFSVVDSTRWIGANWWWIMLIMVIGPVIGWLSSLTLYGFGELVENSSKEEKTSIEGYGLLLSLKIHPCFTLINSSIGKAWHKTLKLSLTVLTS